MSTLNRVDDANIGKVVDQSPGQNAQVDPQELGGADHRHRVDEPVDGHHVDDRPVDRHHLTVKVG